MSKTIQIAPSVLSADFSEILPALASIEESGCTWAHLDVMDGMFVPNLTFGPKFIKDIRKKSSLFFDTHLMIQKPERYIKEFAQAGSDCITVHTEACSDVDSVIDQIHSFGCKAGLSICPSTSVETLLPYISKADLFLIMTVNPGFGGQSLIESCLEKITVLDNYRKTNKLNYIISVDGGVNLNTVDKVRNSGVDVAVAGSAFFSSTDRKDFIIKMTGIDPA